MSKKVTEEKTNKKEAKKQMDAKMTGLLDNLRKQFGEESIYYGDMPIKEVETLSTGSISLDIALGVGGYPKGRIVEIYGPESSGKTTLTLHAIASAQKQGLKCAFIDAEHAFDPKYAKRLGVDMKELMISQPDNGEQALDIARAIAESGAVQVIVIDSVAALVPKSELEGDMDKASVGVQARMMSKALRTMTGAVSNNDVIVFFINQIRMKIGVMFGDPRTTTGGEGLKFYASIRLSVSAGEKVKNADGKIVGGKMSVKVIKNKVAPPFSECIVPVVYGEGIDKAVDLYIVAREWQILAGNGGSHSFEGEKVATKKDDMVKLMKSDEAFFNRVDKAVRTELKRRMESGSMDTPEPTDEDLAEAEEVTPDEE